jgi:hypothetical protein
MNYPRLTLLAFLVAGTSSLAAEPPPASTPPPSRSTALPPPGLEDKGVATDPAPAVDTSVEPAMPDTRPVRDKASRDRDEAVAQIRSQSDSVTRRQEGDDAVEEYREKGRLRMVRITPRSGPEQIYLDNNNDGRLERDSRDGPVSPVYFTIYQWD